MDNIAVVPVSRDVDGVLLFDIMWLEDGFVLAVIIFFILVMAPLVASTGNVFSATP